MRIWEEIDVFYLGDQERHLGAGINLNQLGLGQMNKSDLVWDEQGLEIGTYRAC